MDFKTETIGNIVTDLDDLEFLTFAEISIVYNGDFWETLNGTSVFSAMEDDNEELFNDKIIKDYTKIYIRYGANL